MPASWNRPKVGRATWVVCGLLAVSAGCLASALPTSAAASDASARAPAVLPARTAAPAPAAVEHGPAVLPLLTLAPEPHPLAHLSARELAALAVEDPGQLGSATLG